MNLRISDMLDDYMETELELQQNMDVSTARIKARTLEKLGTLPAKSGRRYGKLLAAVAAAIALLGCVAYAGATMLAKAQTAERSQTKTGTSVNYGVMEMYIPGVGETCNGTMSRVDSDGAQRVEAVCYTNVGAVFSVDSSGPYYAVSVKLGWLPGQDEPVWKTDALSSACSGGEGEGRYEVRVYSGAAFAHGGLLMLQAVSSVEFGEINGNRAFFVTTLAALHAGKTEDIRVSGTADMQHILYYDQNTDCVVYLTGRDTRVLTQIAEELELTRTDKEITPEVSGEMRYFVA